MHTGMMGSSPCLGGLPVFRDLMIVAVVLLAMAAAVVGVFAGGMLHLKAVQKAASDNPPTPATPRPADSQPATRDSALATADAADAPASSIDLWAEDAKPHGDIQLVEGPVNVGKGRHRGEVVQAPRHHLSGFRSSRDYAEWPIEVQKAGEYEIALNCACADWQHGHFIVRIFNQELPFVPFTARTDTVFRKAAVGRITLPAGKTTLRIQAAPEPSDHPFLNLREVEVVPKFQDAAPVAADP